LFKKTRADFDRDRRVPEGETGNKPKVNILVIN